MDISELINTATGERKYLNADERKAFLDATTYQSPDAEYYCRMLFTGVIGGECSEDGFKDVVIPYTYSLTIMEEVKY